MSWNENLALLNDLWPNADIRPALNDLFAERLSGLDQDVLSESIKAARIDSRFHTPELGEILQHYHKAKRMSVSSWQPPERVRRAEPTPGVDQAEEAKTLRDIRILMRDCEHTVEAVEQLIEDILDAMVANRIGTVLAHRQLVPLQALRFTLLGRRIKPEALDEARRIWPDMPREATGGPQEAEEDEADTEWGDLETAF